MSKAIGLSCISRKAYAYVLHSMQIPLPSESTLSRWTRTFQLGLGGMIHAAVWVLQAAVQEMSAMDRVCCICFDEMSINRRPTYDQSVLQRSQARATGVRKLRRRESSTGLRAARHGAPHRQRPETRSQTSARPGLRCRAAAVPARHPAEHGVSAWSLRGPHKGVSWAAEVHPNLQVEPRLPGEYIQPASRDGWTERFLEKRRSGGWAFCPRRTLATARA